MILQRHFTVQTYKYTVKNTDTKYGQQPQTHIKHNL